MPSTKKNCKHFRTNVANLNDEENNFK